MSLHQDALRVFANSKGSRAALQALSVLFVCMAACSGARQTRLHTTTPQVHGGRATEGVVSALRTQPEGPESLPETLRVPATEGSIADSATDIALQGRGADDVGAFALEHGIGEVFLQGHSVPLLVTAQQPWPGQGYTLYQALAVEPTKLWLLWFYCSASNKLEWIYYENTAGVRIRYIQARGACGTPGSGTGAARNVHLPAFELPLPASPPRFELAGEHIAFDGAQAGWVDLPDGRYALFPFGEVNCRTACGSPGWTELHALLWHAERSRLVVTIVYLRKDALRQVQLGYSFGLPALDRPAESYWLDAQWRALD